MSRDALGKLAYGLLFNVVLPLALWRWAVALDAFVRLPVPVSGFAALGFVAVGLAMIVTASWVLRTRGGGLPMNPYPPPRLVVDGPYALFAHPIYVGGVCVCAGVAGWFRSPGGFWIVTPTLSLAAAALVWGYEARDLTARFPDRAVRAWWSLPADDDATPTLAEQLSTFAQTTALWTALYALCLALPPPRDGISSALPGESAWPVWEYFELPYASLYVAVATAPFVLRRRADLRRLVVRARVAMLVIFPLFVCAPIAAPPRAFVARSVWGELLMAERAADTPWLACPSFHVVWAALVAAAWSARWPRARWAFVAYAAVVSLACFATGMHTVVDVVTGALAAWLCLSWERAWQWLRARAEQAANSWREWRVGPVRVIGHAAWAGAATWVGLALVSALLGPARRFDIAVCALAGLVGAGAWAQYIEGSARLMRPYGYYGGVLGFCAGAALCDDPWPLLAACCVAGPWTQSLGRVRCLVQGCCHGAPAPESVGIVYRHPRSRVVRLSSLGGVAVHPTPLYAMLWNTLIALCVARLWCAQAPATFVCGAYMILTGCGRFVEESLRGEPQTPVRWGLRLYQWVALATVIVGAALTATPRGAVPATLHASWQGAALAAGLAVVNAFALGVDFPDSQRPLSRLA